MHWSNIQARAFLPRKITWIQCTTYNQRHPLSNTPVTANKCILLHWQLIVFSVNEYCGLRQGSLNLSLSLKLDLSFGWNQKLSKWLQSHSWQWVWMNKVRGVGAGSLKLKLWLIFKHLTPALVETGAQAMVDRKTDQSSSTHMTQIISHHTLLWIKSYIS